MAYKLLFSDQALSKLEGLGHSDAKRLKQVFMKVLSLRRNPYPQDAKELRNFSYQGKKGLRVDQGEYRIVYAVKEEAEKEKEEEKKVVYVALILSRKDNYRELEGLDG